MTWCSWASICGGQFQAIFKHRISNELGPMLLLKKHLVDLVRAGKKRQTIRYWNRPIVFAGQISFTPGLGKMKILRVEELAGYQSLTLHDARDDGFETLEELLAELKRNYPEVPPGKRLYRIVFQWPVALPSAEAMAENKPAKRFATGSATAAAIVDVPKSAAPTEVRGKSIQQHKSKDKPGAADAGNMSAQQRELLRNWVMSKRPGSHK